MVKEKPIEDTVENTTEEREETKIFAAIDEANRAADRLARENKVKEDLLRREEALMVERKLGGRTDAGTSQAKKEETPAEYAARMLKGDDDE